jgi:uncharacterized RmlC-like cupin family protein
MATSAVAHVHVHERTDTGLYTVAGYGLTFLGTGLTPVLHGSDEAFLIPAGEPHVGINLSAVEYFRMIEVRTDDPTAHDVRLVPELQAEAERIAAIAQHAFHNGRDALSAIASAQ